MLNKYRLFVYCFHFNNKLDLSHTIQHRVECLSYKVRVITIKKTSIVLMLISLTVSLFMITKGIILNEEVKFFLMIFFIVGLGLALLRLFVNNSIKKMKGKSIYIKILFFAVLLGIGLPFQSWFRNDVLLSMDSSFLPSSLLIMVAGLIFMTTLFGMLTETRNRKRLAE